MIHMFGGTLRRTVGFVAVIVAVASGCSGCVARSNDACGYLASNISVRDAVNTFVRGIADRDVETICSVVTGSEGQSPSRERIREALPDVADNLADISGGTFAFGVSVEDGFDELYNVGLSYNGRRLVIACEGDSAACDSGQQLTLLVRADGYARAIARGEQSGMDARRVVTDDGAPFAVIWRPESLAQCTLGDG